MIGNHRNKTTEIYSVSTTMAAAGQIGPVKSAPSQIDPRSNHCIMFFFLFNVFYSFFFTPENHMSAIFVVYWINFGCFVPMIADHDLVKKR
jgi:hypothetical protein